MSAIGRFFRSFGGFSFADANRPVVGVISVATLAGLAVFAFAVGTLGIFEETYQMSGVFSESGGVRSGDKVRVAGIDVGSITSVEPDFQQGYVVITWDVDQGVDVGSDATAEISLATLLGGRYLRLGGQFNEPFMADLPTEQRRITSDRTRVPIGVVDALGRVTRTVDEIDVDSVDELVQNLAALAEDNTDAFEPLLDDVSALAMALNSRRDQIDLLLDETNNLTSSLAAKDDALVELIDQAGALLDEVAQRRDQLRSLLGSGSDVAEELDRLVATNRESLDRILANNDATLDVVRGRLPELNQALAFLAPAVGGLESTTQSGPWIDALITGTGLVQLTDILESAAG